MRSLYGSWMTAVSALQDRADVRAASAARAEAGSVSHEALISEFNL